MKHVYFREINLSANDSLAVIARSVNSGCRVLDVGTGAGALGRYLLTQNCVTDGITYSDEEAALASANYRQIAVINLEQTLASAHFTPNTYDFIICADILEHLRNPVEVLSDLRALLRPDGKILISIPNATYLGVILNLLSGNFSRTREGILDATHVNFLDRRGVSTLVEQSGFAIAGVQDIRKPLIESEFAQLDAFSIPAAVRQYAEAHPDADVYQFVWELVSTNEPIPQPTPSPDKPDLLITPQFAAQLFWDIGAGMTEEKSAYAYGKLCEEPQTLRFSIEPDAIPKKIRLDLADRPGVFEFFSFRLLDANENEIFNWQGDWQSNLIMNDCQLLNNNGINGGRLVRATSNDPWICLSAEAGWPQARFAELTMTAPQPYQDAAFIWAESRYRKLLEASEHDYRYLVQQHLALTNDYQTLQSQLGTLQSRLDTLQSHIQAMENSTSWRITAGIRWLSRLLKKH